MERRFYKIEAKKNTKKLNVAAYARVSTSEKSQITSLSQQISYYNNLIQNNPNWNFVKIYVDNGISGTGTKERAGFNEMIDACKNHKIDLILTKSISRFARNTVDLLQTTRMLKKLNIEVQFEKERLNSSSKEGELMLSLLAGFAQNESQSISENIKWGIRKGYEKGKIRKQKVYGYDVVNDVYQINQKEGKVVRFIFDSFMAGDDRVGIADKLNSLNIPSSHNLKWSRMMIKKLLQNERYAGYTLLQKSYTIDPITKKNIKNDKLPMYRVDDSNPAIVSLEEFEKVQELLKTYNQRVNRWKRRGSWYTSLVKCKDCGGIMALKTKPMTFRCLEKDKHNNCTNGNGTHYDSVVKSLKKAGITKFDDTVRQKIKSIIAKGDEIQIIKF